MNVKEKVTNPGESLLIKIGLAIREVFPLKKNKEVIITHLRNALMVNELDFPEPRYTLGHKKPSPSVPFRTFEVGMKEITFMLSRTRYFIICGYSERTGNVYVNLETLHRLRKEEELYGGNTSS